MFKTIATGAVALAMTAIAANATPIDFTLDGSYSIDSSNTITGTTGAFSYTVTTVGGPINLSEAGPGPIAPIAGDNDGLGVRDDELTFETESIIIEFNTEVTLTALYFLDLFMPEEGWVEYDGGSVYAFASAVDPAVDNVGFNAFTGLSLTGTTFTFLVDAPNDPNTPIADYALAAIEVAPIPLPAGILLLGGALAGLGVARRRNKAA